MAGGGGSSRRYLLIFLMADFFCVYYCLCLWGYRTVRSTSIDHPQIEGKFTATPDGLPNLFYDALTSSMIVVNATIKYLLV